MSSLFSAVLAKEKPPSPQHLPYSFL
jgi:hypothetical protein